jgi:hypothetical protein
MSKTIFLGLIIGAVAMIIMASSILPNSVTGKCNPQGSTTGNPHGFQNPTGNPHDTDNDDSDDDTGNPHRECDPNDDE